MKGNFQIILTVVFIVAGVLAVLVFAGVIKLRVDKDKTTATGTVVIWGTVRADLMAPLFEEFNNINRTFTTKYVQKASDTFNQELLEALAVGKGPDLFFIADNLAYDYSDKIFTIPYESYPLVSFKQNYVGAGEVFLTSKGILAFPLTVDPLIMYYNRTILDNDDIIYPPIYWDEFGDIISSLTKKDENRQIIKSAVALGQFSNIANAKDILITLFMQAGSKIVSEENGRYFSDFGSLGGDKNFDLGPILSFYTNFADPLNQSYSWNKSLPYSRDFFSADNLAFYFGFAGELKTLINKNPNQNFAIARIPQIKNSNVILTYARVSGIAISSFSKNFNTAFIAANLMSSGNFASQFVDVLGVAPARRDLLAKKQASEVYIPIFYSSALIAKSWLDPSSLDTDNIFRNMTDKVLSNTLTPNDAVSDAASKLNFLLRK
jgi:ABC-type glycerol-3-phosphate transport system substrate-binding protein